MQTYQQVDAHLSARVPADWTALVQVTCISAPLMRSYSARGLHTAAAVQSERVSPMLKHVLSALGGGAVVGASLLSYQRRKQSQSPQSRAPPPLSA
eukprot:SAG31_NODE_9431_length_1278_cov_1.410517_2_plen_95_part_01